PCLVLLTRCVPPLPSSEARRVPPLLTARLRADAAFGRSTENLASRGKLVPGPSSAQRSDGPGAARGSLGSRVASAGERERSPAIEAKQKRICLNAIVSVGS